MSNEHKYSIKWLRIIDYFIHNKLYHDRDTLYVARLFVSIVLVYLCILIVTCAYFGLFSSLMSLSSLTGVGVCCFIFGVLCWLLSYLRRTGNYLITANSMVGMITLSLIFGVIVSTGPVTSPVIPLLYVPTVLSFLFLDRRYALFWTLLVLSCEFGMIYLQYQGVEFIDTMDPNSLIETRLVIFIIGFFVVLGLILTYDHNSKHLKQERDLEHERFVFLASHDKLTMLANRTKFEEVLQKTLRWHGRRKGGGIVALFYMDLDGFKPINDNYGHKTGDQVLKEVAIRLRQVLRDSDLIARHGGDEFMIMLDHLQDYDAIDPIVEKILQTVSAPIKTSAATVTVTGSIGVALFPNHCLDMDKLMDYADKAMYEAKNRRLGWCMYAPPE